MGRRMGLLSNLLTNSWHLRSPNPVTSIGDETEIRSGTQSSGINPLLGKRVLDLNHPGILHPELLFQQVPRGLGYFLNPILY